MSKEMRIKIKNLIDRYFTPETESPVWAWDLADNIDKIISQEKVKSYEQGVKEGKK